MTRKMPSPKRSNPGSASRADVPLSGEELAALHRWCTARGVSPHPGDRPGERDAALRQWAAVEVQGYKPRSPKFNLSRLRELWHEARAGFDAERRSDPNTGRVGVVVSHRAGDDSSVERAGELRIVVGAGRGANEDAEREAERSAGAWVLRAMVALRRCVREDEAPPRAEELSAPERRAIVARVRAYAKRARRALEQARDEASRTEGQHAVEEVEAALEALDAPRRPSRSPLEDAHYALGRMCLELGILVLTPGNVTAATLAATEARERETLHRIVESLRVARTQADDSRDLDDALAYEAIERYAGLSEGAARRLASAARARAGRSAGS